MNLMKTLIDREVARTGERVPIFLQSLPGQRLLVDRE
jgi:hypothetical protein